MFSAIFSGYLTKDASFGTYGNNSVLNFTVTVHYPTNKKDEQGQPIRETVFLNCSRWYKGNEFSNLQLPKKRAKSFNYGKQIADCRK